MTNIEKTRVGKRKGNVCIKKEDTILHIKKFILTMLGLRLSVETILGPVLDCVTFKA